MQINDSEKPFERYADEVVVHCKTEKQYAKYVYEQKIEEQRDGKVQGTEHSQTKKTN